MRLGALVVASLVAGTQVAAADEPVSEVVRGTAWTVVEMLAAGTGPARATFTVASPSRPTGPWPRLGTNGFAGLTARQMGTKAALERAFPGARIECDDTSCEIYLGSTEVARVSLEDGKVDRIRVEEPGITTMHGLAVGSPFKDVLVVKDRRTCETRWEWAGEGQQAGFVRCWIGPSRARFRYVTQLTRSNFSLGPGPNLTKDTSLPEAPRGGAELDRWIATSGATVELVLWHRTPSADAP